MENNKQLAIPEKHQSYLQLLQGIQSPEQVDKFIKDMTLDTPKSIIFSQNEKPSIVTVARENMDFYLKCVEMMLAKLMLALNVRNSITPEQVELIPSLLLSEFPAFRLNDIWHVCKNIMVGKYTIYERLDTESFFRCVREYDASDERITAREQFHQQKHLNKDDAAKDFTQLPKEIQEMFSKRNEAKPIIKPTDVPPMSFKITDLDRIKKLKNDGQ